jgi:cardiolipin synthase (CMP-forming)
MPHLPNIITIARLASMPFIAWLLLRGAFAPALALFAISAATDSLDGWLARRNGWESRFGAIADPIADKLLLVISYLCLGWLGAMPRWLVWIVLGRDLLILAFAAVVFSMTKLRDFPPSQWGKLSTFFQILGAGAVMVRYTVWPGVPLPPFFGFAAAWTIGSGLHYFITAVQRLRTGA